MEWISVKDRLPEEERVLVNIPQCGYFIADYINGKWWEDEIGYIEGVTHWMLLPELPTSID